MQLFREEVLRGRMGTPLGALRVGRPPSFAIVTAATVLIGVALVCFAAWGQVTRKATLQGLLLPALGSLPITTPQGGVLAERHVAEGEAVAQGQTLFVLDLDRDAGGGRTGAFVAQAIAARRATLETELRLIEQQAHQRDAVLGDRLRSLEADQRRAHADAADAQRRVDLTARTLDRYSQLARDGFVSPLQAQGKEQEWLDAAARERDVQRIAAAMARDIEATRADRVHNAAQVQAEQARLERALAMLDQEASENDSRRRIVFTAPKAGVISALTVHLGQTVVPGQSLATLAAHDVNRSPGLEAHLYAASRTAGFIASGQRVWVRYDAFPHQKFGMAEGEIAAISRSPIALQDLPPGLQATEPLYRITVTLSRQSVDAYGETVTLKPGMTLQADVLQDRRAIWEWLLEPVLAASARLSNWHR